MKPFDILYKVILDSVAYDNHPRSIYSKPGDMIKRLSLEDREILKQLKSEDTINKRPLFK